MNTFRFLYAAFVLSLAAAGFADEPTPQELFSEAVELFFDAKPLESARVFDQLVVAEPRAEPELWQRGLACTSRPWVMLQKPGSTSSRRPGPFAWTTTWARSPSCTRSCGAGLPPRRPRRRSATCVPASTSASASGKPDQQKFLLVLALDMGLAV